MDVQDAIKPAKAFVGVAFSDEDVGQVRTEEVESGAVDVVRIGDEKLRRRCVPT